MNLDALPAGNVELACNVYVTRRRLTWRNRGLNVNRPPGVCIW